MPHHEICPTLSDAKPDGFFDLVIFQGREIIKFSSLIYALSHKSKVNAASEGRMDQCLQEGERRLIAIHSSHRRNAHPNRQGVRATATPDQTYWVALKRGNPLPVLSIPPIWELRTLASIIISRNSR